PSQSQLTTSPAPVAVVALLSRLRSGWLTMTSLSKRTCSMPSLRSTPSKPMAGQMKRSSTLLRTRLARLLLRASVRKRRRHWLRCKRTFKLLLMGLHPSGCGPFLFYGRTTYEIYRLLYRLIQALDQATFCGRRGGLEFSSTCVPHASFQSVLARFLSLYIYILAS